MPTLAFPFGAVDQASGKRHLLAGELTEAGNTRMVLEGEYRKRLGFDQTVVSTYFGVGGVASAPTEYTCINNSDVWITAFGQAWARDPDSGIAYHLGSKAVRPFPTYLGVNKIAGAVQKQLAVLAGNDLWLFQQDIVPGATASASYSFIVYDATTLVQKQGPTTVTLTGAVLDSVTNWDAAYDSVNQRVWVVMVGLSGGAISSAIECHRFDATAPQSAHVVTTYENTATREWNTINIKKLSNGEFLVATSSFVAGTPHVVAGRWSYLTLTGGSAGTAKGAPAAVEELTNPTGTDPRCGSGMRILNYDGANGTAYLAFWRTTVGTANAVQLVLLEVNTTTLALSAGPHVLISKTGITQVANPIVGVCSGFRNPSTGNREVLGQIDINDTVRPDELIIERAIWSGSSAVTTVARNAWLASDPFNQGTSTSWYFVTGYDDGQTLHAQRTLFLREKDGTIVSKFSYGESAAAWNRAVGRDSGGGAYQHYTGFVTAPINPATSKWMVAQAIEDSANEAALSRVVQLDFTEVYAPPVVVGDVALFGGPLPMVAGPKDSLHDLGPALFPSRAPTFTLGAGGALGNFQVAYVYRFQDASGRVYRSTPSATATAAFLDSGTRQVKPQSLCHIGAGKAFIEVYGSVAGGTTLFLQQVAANEPTADTTTINVNPERWLAGGETLYTTGGALSNAPPPPARVAGLWRGRVFLGGTDYNEDLWASQELRGGRGPEFNEVLIAPFVDGTGPIRVLCPVSNDYFSAHKPDGSNPAIGTITGPGPDGRGAGNYVVSTVKGRKAARVGSAADGPEGCYFQNVADGRICLLPPGATKAIDVGQGVEDHRSSNVVAALHVEGNREVWFFTASARILVLDYGHPTQKHPAGRWHVWSGTGISVAAAGAAMSSSGPRWIQNSTTHTFRHPFTATFRDNDGSLRDVLQKLKLSKLAPAGHQGAFLVRRLKFLGQHVGASALLITVTNSDGVGDAHPQPITSSPLDYQVTPINCLRTEEVEVTIEETSSTTEGFVYDSLAMELELYGSTKFPASSQWM
jgi:hypothetical protein